MQGMAKCAFSLNEVSGDTMANNNVIKYQVSHATILFRFFLFILKTQNAECRYFLNLSPSGVFMKWLYIGFGNVLTSYRGPRIQRATHGPLCFIQFESDTLIGSTQSEN